MAPAVQPALPPPPPPVAAPAPTMVAPPPKLAAPPPAQPLPPVQPYDHVVFPAADAPVFREPPPSRLSLAPAPAPEEIADRDEIYWNWGSKWPGLAVGPRFGTAGVGADLTFGVTRHLNLRGGFGYASLGWKQKYGSVSYDTDLDMLNVPLLVDLYPAGGHFRLVGGVFLQPMTQLDLESTPGGPVQIGNHTYGPDVVGTLTGKIKAGALAPYLGIGFGNAVGENQWLTFTFDIGVLFQTYDVSLASDGAGMTAKLDTFREDMQKERARIEKDMDRLTILPVLTLGLSLHF